MEKLAYAVWKAAGDRRENFAARLLNDVSAILVDARVARLQVNVVDESVADAHDSDVRGVHPKPDGFISFWINSGETRGGVEDVIRAATDEVAGYCVSENVILPLTEPTPNGSPTEGYSQLAFWTRRRDLGYEEAINIWRGDHRFAAADTQSNFYYAQNLIVRQLTRGPEWTGFAEECFPLIALGNPEQQFNCPPGDWQSNQIRCRSSAARFIDEITAMRTRQYRYGQWCDLTV